MRCNPREVALSSALRDNSTNASNFTSFVFSESYYYREPPAPAGGGSTAVGSFNCQGGDIFTWQLGG